MTNGRYDVAIVGAGPAGSSLAILLAQRGWSVALLEKHSMPRDKLCGEFLSTEVESMCARLGVGAKLAALGANPIRRALCTTPSGAELSVSLPGTAHGISRRALDELLFKRAGEVGADCRDGTAVYSILGSLGSGFQIDTAGGALSTRVVFGAYGRRTSLDRKLHRQSLTAHSPYVAFKAHFAGSFPGDSIELHCFRQGYCGMLVEEEGHVNVCWIVHHRRLNEAGGNPNDLLAAMSRWNPHLGDRLKGLRQVHPYLAVGQLSFRRKELFAGDICMIGDAAGMIAPLCGDGMGMAMRSAELAAPLAEEFLRGESEPQAVKHAYRRAWAKEFRARMVIGRTLQRLCMRPLLLAPSLRLAGSIPGLARAVVSATRG